MRKIKETGRQKGRKGALELDRKEMERKIINAKWKILRKNMASREIYGA